MAQRWLSVVSLYICMSKAIISGFIFQKNVLATFAIKTKITQFYSLCALQLKFKVMKIGLCNQCITFYTRKPLRSSFRCKKKNYKEEMFKVLKRFLITLTRFIFMSYDILYRNNEAIKTQSQ